MQFLLSFLFRGPFWVQLVLAAGLVWLGVTADRTEGDRLAARQALIAAAPPATIPLDQFSRPKGAKGPVEVSVLAQLALDHNTRLVRKRNGVTTGEDLMYVLMAPDASKGSRMVLGAILIDPDRLDAFAEWAIRQTTGFGAEGPIVTLDGLVTSEARSSHAHKALTENGLKAAPGFIFIEPFVEGRAATLAADKQGNTRFSLYIYGFAGLMALIGLVKMLRSRGAAARPRPAPTPAAAAPAPGFVPPAWAAIQPTSPPTKAAPPPQPAAIPRPAITPQSRPDEGPIRSGDKGGSRSRLLGGLVVAGGMMVAAWSGLLPGGLTQMNGMPTLSGPEAEAPVAKAPISKAPIPAPVAGIAPAVPAPVVQAPAPPEPAPAPLTVEKRKPMVQAAPWFRLLGGVQDLLPGIIGAVLTLLGMVWIVRRALRRAATGLRRAGIDPFDRFAERVRSGSAY